MWLVVVPLPLKWIRTARTARLGLKRCDLVSLALDLLANATADTSVIWMLSLRVGRGKWEWMASWILAAIRRILRLLQLRRQRILLWCGFRGYTTLAAFFGHRGLLIGILLIRCGHLFTVRLPLTYRLLFLITFFLRNRRLLWWSSLAEGEGLLPDLYFWWRHYLVVYGLRVAWRENGCQAEGNCKKKK